MSIARRARDSVGLLSCCRQGVLPDYFHSCVTVDRTERNALRASNWCMVGLRLFPPPGVFVAGVSVLCCFPLLSIGTLTTYSSCVACIRCSYFSANSCNVDGCSCTESGEACSCDGHVHVKNASVGGELVLVFHSIPRVCCCCYCCCC